MCWYCYWGWAKPVADIYTEALRRLDGNDRPLHYGPAHIVWEDSNFDCADWCLEHFNDYKRDFSEKELSVVRWSLEELAKLPPDVADIIPGDYDLCHPELYPPTVEVVKVW